MALNLPTLTGLPISVMEPAIVARLRLAFPERDFTIQRVPQTLSLKEFEQVVRYTPFIGLAWTGFRPDAGAGRTTVGAMQWRLILVNKATSGLETRFKGDARGIGLDPMSDLAMVLLQGAVFDGIGHSTVTGANAIFADGWSDDAVVLAQVDFEIRFGSSPAALNLVTPADFQKLGITWLNADSTDTANGPVLTSDIPLNSGGP